jgi:hypothetical protein
LFIRYEADYECEDIKTGHVATQTTSTSTLDDTGFTTVRRKQRPRKKAKSQRSFADVASSVRTRHVVANTNTNVNERCNPLGVANKVNYNSNLRTATNMSKMLNNNVRHSRFVNIFVSRLHANTNVQDIKCHIHDLCKEKFRIQKLVTKYNGYSSVKLSVPHKIKGDILNKQNWPEGVYIRTFVESR